MAFKKVRSCDIAEWTLDFDAKNGKLTARAKDKQVVEGFSMNDAIAFELTKREAKQLASELAQYADS